MRHVKAETAFSSLQRSSAGLQKHGVALGLLTAAVGAVWFASRVQAGNEKAILQVQHELKEQKLERKADEERVRREMLQRVLDISYHADWQGVRERGYKTSSVEDDSA